MNRKLVIALIVVVVAAEVLRQLDTPRDDTCCPCCAAMADLDMTDFEAEFGSTS